MALSTRSDNLYTPIGIIRTGCLKPLNDPNKASIPPLFYLYSTSPAFCAVLFTQNAQPQKHFFRHIFLTKKEMKSDGLHLSCDSGGIQTHNLLIRSQMLYSVELRNPLFLFAGAKVRTFSELTKSFRDFFRKKCYFARLLYDNTRFMVVFAEF